MVEPRGLGTLRIAVSLAALAVLPAWGSSHSVSIGATVVAPSKCRLSTSGYAAPASATTGGSRDGKVEAFQCEGPAATTVSWSVGPQGAAQTPDAMAGRTQSVSTENHAETLVLTITP